MILSKYEFQSQQALCLMEGGGGGVRPPDPSPGSAAEQLPIEYPRCEHNTILPVPRY